MRTRLPSRRLALLLGLLLAIVVVGVGEGVHLAWLDQELEALAEHEMSRMRKEGVIAPGQDAVAEAAAAKQWPVFGQPFGKVTLYTRIDGKGGSTRYGMLDLHYERRDSGWVQTESGYCMGRECVPAATRAFAAAE